jgi:transposase
VDEALGPYWDRIKVIGVESTYNWYWLVDGLRAAGRDVRLANPAAMSQYEGLKHTDDATDAAWLAEQLRLGILPESYIYPIAQRGLRDLLRRRSLLVNQRTRVVLCTQGLMARHGIEPLKAGALKTWRVGDFQTLGLDRWVELQLIHLVEVLQAIHHHVEEIEEELGRALKSTADMKRVQQVPGIGPVLGMHVVLETGEINRFASASRYASYCRAVKAERSSNAKKKAENNRRNGNRFLGWAFVEAAHHAAAHYPRIQGWFDRKKRKRNTAVATKALACKLAKATWHVLKGERYEEQMLFG